MQRELRQPAVLAGGISLFFPAYNEADNVAGTIEQSRAILETLGCPYEIIIVDDGSKDRTSEIVQNYANRDRHVVLKRHEKNRGYGEALQTGFHSCRYGLIFFSDCDLQFDLAELTSFIHYLNENPEFDAVIGYRIKRADPFIRKFNAFGWKLWARLLFGLKVRDIDCAFKLFKKEIFDRITIESRGALISVELLTKIKNMGYKLAELGVHHYPRKAGVQTGAKFSVILRAFYESFTLYGKIRAFNRKYAASKRQI